MKKHLFFAIIVLGFAGCFGPELEELSFFEVTTAAPEASAELGRIRLSGVLTRLDNEQVSDHGFVWSTSLEALENAPENASRHALGSASQDGLFEWTTPPLSIDSVYYFKAYAIAGDRAVYGTSQAFFWGVTVNFVEAKIFNDSVVVTCNIQGLQARQTSIEAFGIVYSKLPNLSQASSCEISEQRSSDGPYTCTLANLDLNTTYYLQPYLKIQNAAYTGPIASFSIRGGWKQTTSMPYPLSWLSGVYTGQQAFIGTGTTSSQGLGGFQPDYDPTFWSFQPPEIGGNGEWTPITTFPNALTIRTGAVHFWLYGKLYVGLGKIIRESGNPSNPVSFFVYDPATNSWDDDVNNTFISLGRSEAVAFTLNNKAYVGTGTRDSNGDRYKDFYEFDPLRPDGMRWRQVASLPDEAVERSAASGFAIDGKGYILGGISGVVDLLDNWVFTPPASDSEMGSWEPMPMTGFTGVSRRYASAFVINDKAYYGLGVSFSNNNFELADFWEYDSSTLTWNRQPDLPANKRARALGLGIGPIGLIVGGDGRNMNNNNETYSDCWLFFPDQSQ